MTVASPSVKVQTSAVPPGQAALRLFAFIDGDNSPEVLAWIRASFVAWLQRGGNLERQLYLTTPARARRAVRDYWLRDAARELSCGASALRKAALRFEARTWPSWRAREDPRWDAPRAERALFYARRAGLAFPRSDEHYGHIIESTGESSEVDSGNAPVTLPRAAA